MVHVITIEHIEKSCSYHDMLKKIIHEEIWRRNF